VPIAAGSGEVYMAFSAKGPTLDTHMIEVARRNAAGEWSLLYCYEDDNKSIAEYPNDSGHRQPWIALDGSGRLHLFGWMHTSAMNYYPQQREWRRFVQSHRGNASRFLFFKSSIYLLGKPVGTRIHADFMQRKLS
jgi:hypothetical protein